MFHCAAWSTGRREAGWKQGELFWGHHISAGERGLDHTGALEKATSCVSLIHFRVKAVRVQLGLVRLGLDMGLSGKKNQRTTKFGPGQLGECSCYLLDGAV